GALTKNEIETNLCALKTDLATSTALLIHNKSWKESNKKLAKVVSSILDILRNIWKNLAFGPKKLSIRKSGYISIAEYQSLASKDQRRVEKWLDIIFITSCND
ncbi:11728_t:CDS:2, partial [Dentiscutata erythropus]